jgi:hypothetical protein
MITIGGIPKELKIFFRSIHLHFGQRWWEYLFALVMANTISHKVTIDKLAKGLTGSTRRTNHGEFLWPGIWDHSSVMRAISKLRHQTTGK